MYIIQLTFMPKKQSPSDDAKVEALRGQGALHPRPKAISDEVFISQEFFDPRDLVQVKYEMLRRHRIDGQQVAEVARRFGVSRQAFYKTEGTFEREGLPGLVPRRRGPRGAHKCTAKILDFAEQWKTAPTAGQTLAEAIHQHFGITINPRSIERALGRRKKKPASTKRKRR
jgi:transposase